MDVRLAWSGPLLQAADSYIEAHPHATYAHGRAWRDTVWKSYHLPPLMLVALEAGRVVGVAPWTLLLNPLVGPYLIVGPFSSFADLLFDGPNVADALVECTVRWGRRFGVRHARIRGIYPAPDFEALDATVSRCRFVCPRVDLREGIAMAWNRLETRARNAVRRAEKSGVTIREATEWEPFMRVVDEGNRRLGSPFHGVRYFDHLRGQWGPDGRFWIAWVEGRPAAVAAGAVHRDTFYYLYGQNIAELRTSAANASLVWHMIKEAAECGLSWVDLGRSEAKSPHELFKRQWGCESRTIHETLIPIASHRLPDLTPTNPRFAFAQEQWARLPLWLTSRLGPWVIRGFG
jgi:hypothetical protein